MKIVLYHANCNDGFCAAWLLRDADKHIPVSYGDPPPEGLSGHDVIIVDFSYPRAVMERLREDCASLLCLDHHKTAEKELLGLDYCIFDMSLSGAQLVQRHFDLGDNWVVDYVGDRDLWKWEQPDSKAVNAFISCVPHTFEAWDKLLNQDRCGIINSGLSILLYQKGVIERPIERAVYVELCGFNVPCLNCTNLISETCGKLAEGHPFAMTWFWDGEVYRFSLRSKEGEVDVSEIAKRMGGGGHRNAAGFEVAKLWF